MRITLFAIAGYILGSIPTGLIIGKLLYNKDIRKYGSGNLGATNAGRVLGKYPGIIVAIVDVLKVFLPAFIVTLSFNRFDASIIGIMGMIGHCYPVFAGFKGGKGVSSFFGILCALNVVIGLSVILLWKCLKHITNYVSLASAITAFISPFIFLIYYGKQSLPEFISLMCAALFVIYKHKSNIERLIAGTENKVNLNRK